MRTWLGGRHLPGTEHRAIPSLAVKTTLAIPHDLDPQATAAEAAAVTEALLDDHGLHSATWAIDPTSWELLVLTLHTGTEHGHVRSEHTQASSPLNPRWGHADSTSYEVLHLSAPGIDALT